MFIARGAWALAAQLNGRYVGQTLRMSGAPSRVQAADYAIASWALLAFFGGLLSCWNGEMFWRGDPNYVDPYAKYNANPGIRALNLAATALDATIVIMVAVGAIRRFLPAAHRFVLMLLSVFAAVFTWVELWYGSTFYYGEVRDKQGLPFGVNNGGALGSFIFLSYVVWTISLPDTRVPRVVVRVGATIALLAAHALVLQSVEEPWKLWQS